MTKADPAAVAVLSQSASHLLHRVLQLALDVYVEETGKGALTQRQYAVLAAAATVDGTSQTDLVRMTGIDRSTLADMVARMIEKGWLERERSKTDARAKTVSLTLSGRATLEAVAPKVQAADERILAALSASRRASFISALSALAGGADEPDAQNESGKKKKKAAARAQKADKSAKSGKPKDTKKKKKKDRRLQAA
jgi:DNA-binding MarR family transcriptional regulator